MFFLVIVGFLLMLSGQGEVGFLLMLLGLIFLVVEHQSLSENPPSKCPPHRWTRRENGDMWCPECKRTPQGRRFSGD